MTGGSRRGEGGGLRVPGVAIALVLLLGLLGCAALEPSSGLNDEPELCFNTGRSHNQKRCYSR